MWQNSYIIESVPLQIYTNIYFQRYVVKTFLFRTNNIWSDEKGCIEGGMVVGLRATKLFSQNESEYKICFSFISKGFFVTLIELFVILRVIMYWFLLSWNAYSKVYHYCMSYISCRFWICSKVFYTTAYCLASEIWAHDKTRLLCIWMAGHLS